MPPKKNVDAIYANFMAMAPNYKQEFLEVGRLLLELREADKDRYRDAMKYSSIKQRTAYYLVKVAEALEGLGFHETRIKNIGWTKLSIIADSIKKENAHDMIKLAELNSSVNLRRLIRKEVPLDNARAINLNLEPDEYEIFRAALLRHGATSAGRTLNGQQVALINALKRLNELETTTTH